MAAAIRVIVGGREIPPSEVERWERRRAASVLRRLGVRDVDAATVDIDDLRSTLTERKLELGHSGIEKRIGRQLAITARVASAAAVVSRGRRRIARTDLLSDTGSATAFAAWFTDRVETADEPRMLVACPDHYMVRRSPQGHNEVTETVGNAPMPLRLTIDYDDLASLRTPQDPDFPSRVEGVASSTLGVRIGGVRHQFRDEGTGFRARLAVEFPVLLPPPIAAAHQMHLACEFSNWIRASLHD